MTSEMRNAVLAPYAPVVLKLLQHELYVDEKGQWDLLLTYQTPIAEYFARIGLELYLNEVEGFAFLRQPELEDDEGQRMPLPRLTRRDKLSYHVTLLCVLLRERLDAYDASTPESDRLILTQDQLYDLLRPFYQERSDERTLLRRLDTTIERTLDLGFLRRLTGGSGSIGDRFEVRRILKARIDADKLAEIKRKLESHVPTDA